MMKLIPETRRAHKFW